MTSSNGDSPRRRVVLIATGGLGGLLLAALLSEGHNIVGVSGVVKVRSGIFEKTWDGAPQPNSIADQANISFFDDERWSESAVVEWLRGCQADLLVVAGSRHMIPQSVCAEVSIAVNLHPAPLPKFPGAYPTPAVLEAGEKETGVTAHIITDELDGGPILLFEPTQIYDGDTYADVDRRNLAAMVKAARRTITGSW